MVRTPFGRRTGATDGPKTASDGTERLNKVGGMQAMYRRPLSQELSAQ